MKLFRKVGSAVNKVGGGIVKSGVNLAGSAVEKKFPETGKYIKEVGETVVNSSSIVIENTTHFADGAANGIYGLAKKDKEKQLTGWEDMKTASTKTVKGVAGGAMYVGKSVGQTVSGVIDQDSDQWKEGLKNLGKVSAVAVVGVGVLDIISVDLVEAEELETRNMDLAGDTHDSTNVPFEKNIVESDTGKPVEGVFPVFDPAFEMELPSDVLQETDTIHIGIANMELHEAIMNNPNLADELELSAKDVDNLYSSVTPDGYHWHHHEEIGRMQLVDENIHQETGHTGGRNVWGGGTEAR